MPSPNRRLAFYSDRVMTIHGLAHGTILTNNGIIEAFLPVGTQASSQYKMIRAEGLVVMPGLVDTHVHINQPGRTEWEGFASATRAAAAGGVTCLVDMPLNSIPVTSTPEALALKVAAASPHLAVDCGFWGGLVPANHADLGKLLASGVLGVKAFLSDSGIDDFPPVTRSHLELAMPVIARAGLPLLVHAELASCVPGIQKNPSQGNSSYATYLQGRPDSWELAAISMMAELAGSHRCRVHIVHLSSAQALPIIAEAKSKGYPLSVETCPHYLCLAAEDIGPGQTLYKCAPPIREGANAAALWHGLQEGTIDFIVSDHSPCSPDLKHLAAGDFMAAWGGISSLQLSLPLVWTYGQRYGLILSQLAELLCERPAIFAGLGGRKGAIAPGYDADLVIWDPEAEFTVTSAGLHFRHKHTPYLEQTLKGQVKATYLRGIQVYGDGAFNPQLRGQPILHGQQRAR